MEVQFRTTKLTPEQEALEAIYHRAAEILQASGINAKVYKLFAPKPSDNPDHIFIEERF